MLNIYIARHGQDEDNAAGILNGHRDMPLTTIGESQAVALAENIKNTQIQFDAVYSSPLQRAYITAVTITNELGLESPKKLDMLIEKHYGVMTGKLIKDIPTLCAPHILRANPITYFLEAEGAESWPDLVTRATTLLNGLKEKHTDGNILLVCHGDIGKMLYASYYNIDWKEVLLQFHFGNSELILLSEGSDAEDSHVFEIQQHNH